MEKRNLWPHLRNAHKRSEEEVQQIREKINRESGKAKISCPSCEELLFMTYEEFANHCRVTHSEDESRGRPQDYSLVQLSFNDEKEYEKWLHEKCEITCTSLYITRSMISGSKKYQYMLCSRAGLRPSQATKIERVSRKENVHCSCFLATEFNADGSVSVKGCFGHVGHDIDPALLRRKDVTTKAQRLKDACYQELSAIKQIQALTQANALAIAELGTYEALEALKEIKAYEELASDIEMFPSSSQVPRPETAQPGAKRKLSTVSHCQRAKLREPKMPRRTTKVSVKRCER
ncbi:hypothetical protein Q1695_004934 [Nippostrongylus brasiliensis]|nr:hypothetical protein Q1695_004934 [Nippostrongylus brasiliensis]